MPTPPAFELMLETSVAVRLRSWPEVTVTLPRRYAPTVVVIVEPTPAPARPTPAAPLPPVVPLAPAWPPTAPPIAIESIVGAPFAVKVTSPPAFRLVAPGDAGSALPSS